VIYRTEAFFWPARIIWNSFVIGVLFATAQVCAFADGSVTLTWSPSTAANVVGYNVYYGGTSGDYTNKISTANTTNTIVSGLTQGSTYYFAVTAYDSSGLESPFSNEASYAVPLNTASNVTITNTPPTLNVIGNLAINENAGEQTVNLSGISAGIVSGKQTIKITAATSNSALITTPKISYTSANSTGTLTFTPQKNATGTATITVTINNGLTKSNTITQTFTVTVNDVNQPPTLNPISNFSLNENAGEQTVDLSGISSGIVSGKQTIKITAATSKSALIPKPKISYTGTNLTGKLTFTPKKNADGTATITVIVNNGQKDNNIVTQTFTVTVIDLNQPPTLNPISNFFLTENAGAQTVDLSGISSGIIGGKQTIKITATSSDHALIPAPKISYASANPIGTLTFTPTKNAIGTATITVTANNGGKDNNAITRTFAVTILAKGSITPTPATLAPATCAKGQFALTVSGSTGMEYIVEASTNLVNWIPVWTNTAPCTYVDVNAGQFNQRFYRSVPAP
jgi:hypothetical protein